MILIKFHGFYLKQKNMLHKEIDYLETYLSDGIDKEIEIRSCPPRI